MNTAANLLSLLDQRVDYLELGELTIGPDESGQWRLRGDQEWSPEGRQRQYEATVSFNMNKTRMLSAQISHLWTVFNLTGETINRAQRLSY